MAEDLSKHTERFLEAARNKEIPKLYCNGFISVMGQGDVSLLLQRNGIDEAVVSMSYTVAKTLSQKLGALVNSLETKSKNTIMTTDDVSKFITLEKEPERKKE